ncbi:HipA domain-containing protein, partial [Klebsiella pneumoniae]
YEPVGGPGIAAIMTFLLGSSEALKDRYDFMKFMVFQWLTGATDGHAKNFSIYLLPGGSYRLTPFYDIISAFPVLGGTGLHLRDLKLSMGLNATKGRKTEINAIYPRHFLATAKAVNFPREQMLAILQEFAGHVPQAIESARRTLPADFSSHVWQAITENMLKLHARLQQGLQAL